MHHLYTYLDYRDYLRDYYEHKKEQTSFFSYRMMGQGVGLDASYLVRLFQKRCHISKRSIPAICRFCHLEEREQEFFETLVYFTKARTEKETKLFFEQLLKIRETQSEKVSPHQYRYYEKWYHSIIRAVVDFMPVEGNYAALGKTLDPPISAAEAKRSVRLLESLGLLVRDDTGRLQVSSKMITTGEKWQAAAIRMFQEQTLDLAKRSLQEQAREVRDISTLTMGIGVDDLPAIREVLKEARKAIAEIANNSLQTDGVFQLNMQLFPVTKMRKKHD